MGRGCGRGGAQLGKAVKGKSKERKKDKLAAVAGAKSKDGAASGEKQLAEDIRLLEEYERINKMAEAQRARLKKLLQQESYNTRLNKRLLTNMYRAVMRLEKVDALRQEIDVVAQNQTRDMDRKDAIIQMLAHDCEESEEQLQTAQRTHLGCITKLVALNGRKLATLEAEFERDLKALKLEFLTERQHLQAQHARETKEMNLVLSAVEQAEQQRILESKQTHETEREEIRNKNLEGINELRINLENKIEDLERQFDDAHSSYVDNTSASNENFKRLKAEDATLSLHIFEKKKKIIRLQKNLQSWRKKMEYNRVECVSRNAQLRQQKEAILGHCNTLKGKMSRFRNAETKRLTELTVLSREALQSNQTHLAQAERLLTLAELSRKMETEREKVTPFYESTNTAAGAASTRSVAAAAAGVASSEYATTVKAGAGASAAMGESKEQDFAATQAAAAEVEGAMAAMQAAVRGAGPASAGSTSTVAGLSLSSNGSIPTAYSAEGVAIDEWSLLENYYKKYNKVLLDKLAIKQEKQRLQNENADLRAILKQYLDGVAITSDAVDRDNPLLIVNGRVNLVDAQVRRGRPRLTQDLGQLVQSHSLQAGTSHAQTMQRAQLRG